MVTELITEKLHIRSWMWRQRMDRAHASHAGLIGDGGQVQLLLGVSGSGVDHLGRLLAQPGFPLRYFQNPLGRFEPRLSLAAGHDPLALPYSKTLERDHPLLRVMRMSMEFDNRWALTETSNKVEAAECESLPCLVKESHALLATEAMLKAFGNRAMLYVSDPVKAVDRLFDTQGLDSAYLLEEGRSVLAPYFLARFLRRDYNRVMHIHRRIRRTQDARRRNILHRVLVIALIQHMFRMLAARYPQQAILVEYDRIADDPTPLEGMLERLLGEPGLEIGRSLMMESTFRPDGQNRVIWKNTWPESKSAAGFLTPGEIQVSYQMLKDSGLATRIADQSRYQPLSSISLSA